MEGKEHRSVTETTKIYTLGEVTEGFPEEASWAWSQYD